MPPPSPDHLFLSTLDIVIIAAYLAVVVSIGFWTSIRKAKGVGEFLVAGRSLTLPVFVATLVSTWYGGILGVGEFSWRHGISTWVVFGVPYYLFAVLYAFVLAPRIRASGVVSLPDKLQEVYGRSSAVAGGVLTFLLVNPAPYALMMGLLLQMFFGWSLAFSLVVGTAASVLFLFVGGLRAGVATNVFEFVMMYAGFAVIVVTAVTSNGGWEFVAERVPETHLQPFGEHSAQYILVWVLIALWTIVDPSFHQRCAAAKDERTARNGILVSVGFWFLFDLMTVSTGIYARVFLPNLEQPALAYPELANLMLPAGLLGLFYAGLLATVMSTLTSLTHIAGLTAGRDIAGRGMGGSGEEAEKTRVRFGMAAAIVLACGLALLLPSVVELWYAVGTCIIPGLLLPVVSAYVPRFRVPPRPALRSMVAGPAVSTLWLIAGYVTMPGGQPLLGLEPIIPGLAVAVGVWGVYWRKDSSERREDLET